MPAGKTTSRRPRAARRRGGRRWVRSVTTVSTHPPRGLFNRDARTIARSLASRRVSPKGPASGLRMLLFYINRGGRGLSPTRRAELGKAKRLMQGMLARRKARARGP
jgi:tRNA(adenine34) deaminase